jgi:hypothetical protein
VHIIGEEMGSYSMPSPWLLHWSDAKFNRSVERNLKVSFSLAK